MREIENNKPTIKGISKQKQLHRSVKICEERIFTNVICVIKLECKNFKNG